MAQSTDAKLWFGFCWTDKDEEYYEDGLPSVVIEHIKKNNPALEEIDVTEFVEKLLEPLGCLLVRHGYCDGGEMFGLAVSASYIRASRGYPIDITGKPHMPGWPPEWRDQLVAAAEAIGWPLKPPAWWLASDWC